MNNKTLIRYYFDYNTADFCKRFYEEKCEVRYTKLQKMLDKYRLIICFR